MLPRSLQFLMLAAITALPCAASGAAQAPAQQPETLVVTGLGRGVVTLGGLWQFKMGDDMAWASPAYNDYGWEKLRVDRSYGEQGHVGTGFAWYRRHIDFVGAEPHQKIALLVFPIGLSDASGQPYEIYWNGVLVGHDGKMPPDAEWPFRPPPKSFGLGEARSGVLAIRTWKAPLKFTDREVGGGIYIPPQVGSPEAVADTLGALDHEWLATRQFYFDEQLLFGILGVLGLLAWLRDRGLKVMLWMAIFALTQPLHVLLYNAHIGFPYHFVYGFDYLTEGIGNISLWYLLLYLLGLDGQHRLKRWTYRLAISNFALLLMEWFVSSRDWATPLVLTWQIADGILVSLITLASLYPLVLIPYGLGKRVSVANWMVAITASVMELITAARIASLSGVRFTHAWGVYLFINRRYFTIRGNYFDAQNIATSLLLIAIVYAVLRYAEEQSRRRGALEQDLRSAQELQRILIPEALPPLDGYAVTSAYRPALEVGGDFFQVILQSDGSALIVLGDVSGKGLKAAMTVSLLVGTVRTFAEQSSDPAAILTGLNRRLEGRMNHGFVTCLVLRVEPSGACSVANAGHLPPFLNQTEMYLPPALPLGLVPEAGYENKTFTMAIGDRLTLYTDGLVEARNASHELFGFGRVQNLMASDVDAHTASEAAVAFGQDDDITVLTLSRLSVPALAAAHRQAPAAIQPLV